LQLGQAVGKVRAPHAIIGTTAASARAMTPAPSNPQPAPLPAPAAGLRRVLFVATDYPPLAGTNTQRIQSFVRHLPRHGWEPWVVTRAVEDLPLIDPEELAWREATERVIRVPDPDPFAALARRRGRGAASVRAAAPPQGAAPQAAAPAAGSALLRWPLDAASSALKTALRYATYHPDALRPWANAAARVAVAQCAHLRPAVVVSSHPAYSAHMAGLAIKRATGLPWVADFRDLWVDRPYRSQASGLHAAIDRRCEAAVVAGCDRIVFASPAWVDRLAARYGEALRAKAVVITNGYERERGTQGHFEWPEWARLRVAFTGSMFSSESPEPLLEAVLRLQARAPELVRGLCVRLAGYGGEHEQALRRRVREAGLEAQFGFVGTQPHAVAVAMQRSADLLALAQGEGHAETIQGKLLEYLATGKPVLAMNAPHGVGAAILKRAGVGQCYAHGDVAGAEALLETCLCTGVPAVQPDWNYIGQYGRAALAGRLAGVLDEVAAVRGVSATLAGAAA